MLWTAKQRRAGPVGRSKASVEGWHILRQKKRPRHQHGTRTSLKSATVRRLIELLPAFPTKGANYSKKSHKGLALVACVFVLYVFNPNHSSTLTIVVGP